MPTPDRAGVVGPATRFIIAGGVNTVLTGALLSVLATRIDPAIAYTLVFAAGVVLATYLAGAFVFRVRMDRRTTAAYVALYMAVYVVGLGVVTVIRRLGIPEGYTGLVVLVTAPLTFIGGRLLLTTTTPETEARRP